MKKDDSRFVVHATYELIDAMRGIGPILSGPWGKDINSACGAEQGNKTYATYSETGRVLGCDNDPVTCPACLRLMFDAIEPVRRDYLLERGMIKELEP